MFCSKIVDQIPQLAAKFYDAGSKHVYGAESLVFQFAIQKCKD
jgi:hypothetical protein